MPLAAERIERMPTQSPGVRIPNLVPPAPTSQRKGPPVPELRTQEKKVPAKSDKPYELLNDRINARRPAAEPGAASGKNEVPQWALHAVLGGFFVAVVLIISGSHAPKKTYDYAEKLKEYREYYNHPERRAKTAPRLLPSADEISVRVGDALNIESRGQKAEALRVWESILLSLGNDSQDPLFEVASGRVNDLE